MKKTILFAVSFLTVASARAQQAGTQAVNADSVPIEEYVPKVIIEGKLGTGGPLTAQLPGGDGGNHKDKPKSEVEKSSETIIVGEDRILPENYGVRKVKGSIEFLNQKGGVSTRIALGRKENWQRVETKGWKGKVGSIQDVKGEVLGNGKNVALLTCASTSVEGWGVVSSTCVFKYLDAKNNILWEKIGVGNASPFWSASSDGRRILLVEDQTPGGLSGTEQFPHRPCIHDGQGGIVWDFGLFDGIDGFKLTKNGKYGFFKYTKTTIIDSKPVTDSGVLFFNVDAHKMHFYKFVKEHLAGHVDISEGGKATLYTVEDEIIDASVRPFKVKTTRHVFHEHQL